MNKSNITNATPMRTKSKLVASSGIKSAVIKPAHSKIACATARNIFASTNYHNIHAVVLSGFSLFVLSTIIGVANIKNNLLYEKAK